MATLTSVLHPDHGFHPITTTTLQIPAKFEQCTVHLVYKLPPLVFVDKYELTNHHESYSFDFWGTSNLEYPVFAVEQSDSILLVNVKQGAKVSVPLHLRYGKPGDGFDETRLSWPAGFLACPVSVEGQPPSNLPEQVAELFKQPVSLVSVAPTSNETEHILRVPVGRPGDLAFVEFGTVLSIFLLFWYLIRVVKRVAVRLNSRKTE
ncbi:PIG-X [Amanita rubescens]|nr:PIG-X [Amanita rubescens]